MIKRKKIFLSIPVFRYLELEAKDSIERLMSYVVNPNCRYAIDKYEELRHESLITRARYKQLNTFLKSDCDYILWIDSDIVCFTDSAIDKMLEIFENDIYHKIGIVGCPYVYKHPLFQPTWVNNDGDLIYDLRRKKERYLFVKYVSSGFMMVSRECVEKVGPEAVNTRFINDTLLSEDWSLCQAAHEKGFDIALRTDVVLGHIGQNIVTLEAYYAILDHSRK